MGGGKLTLGKPGWCSSGLRRGPRRVVITCLPLPGIWKEGYRKSMVGMGGTHDLLQFCLPFSTPHFNMRIIHRPQYSSRDAPSGLIMVDMVMTALYGGRMRLWLCFNQYQGMRLDGDAFCLFTSVVSCWVILCLRCLCFKMIISSCMALPGVSEMVGALRVKLFCYLYV